MNSTQTIAVHVKGRMFMRPPVPCVLVTFATTSDSIQMEKTAKAAGLPGRLIPVPGSVSAGCGYCWMVPAEDRTTLDTFLQTHSVPIEGIYERSL